MRKLNNKLPKSRACYPTVRRQDKEAPDLNISYHENTYINGEREGGLIESIPGFRKICKTNEKIYSISFVGSSEEGGYLLIHSGNRLYRLAIAERDNDPTLLPIAELEDRESYAFSFGSVCFFADGVRLTMVDCKGNAERVSEQSDISECRCAAIYDGRLFLSGNPNRVGRVYYSSPLKNSRLSFSDENSFVEGAGIANIKSLVSLNGCLWLFKECCDGDGEIICRKATVGEGYPIVRVIDGLLPIISATSQGGEIILLTHNRLISLSDTEGGEEKTAMSLPFMSEQVKAEIGRWMGYIVLFLGERIYLIKKRDDGEYDRFVLSGIGGYKNDRRVYRYSEKADSGCLTHKRSHQIAEGEIYSRGTESGMIYYSAEEGKCYSVYPTAMMSGGEFMPARRLYANGRLMWFSTDDGEIYLFNNDKEGENPDNIAFSHCEEYGFEPICRDSRIHPLFYSFALHAPSYAPVNDSEAIPGR